MINNVKRPDYSDINIKTRAQMEEERRKKMAEEDINKIKEAINIGNQEKMEQIHREIDAKYQAVIQNWGLSMNCYNPNFGFDLYSFI